MKKLLLVSLALNAHAALAIECSGVSCNSSWQELKERIAKLQQEAKDLVQDAKDYAFLTAQQYTDALRAHDNCNDGYSAEMPSDVEKMHNSAKDAFNKAVRASSMADKLSTTWSFFKKRLIAKIKAAEKMLDEAKAALQVAIQ